jgi:hypothetical protein
MVPNQTAAEEADSLRQLRSIPGVGVSIARDLLGLGFRRVAELRGQDPEELYERLCRQQGMHVDRCMLYVFRCAVYFAETEDPEPELLRWWSWKDGGAAYRTPRP